MDNTLSTYYFTTQSPKYFKKQTIIAKYVPYRATLTYMFRGIDLFSRERAQTVNKKPFEREVKHH